jgi:DNA-binding transcriptional ArsR family regulator
MPEIIAPKKTIEVAFSLEPALSATNSLGLLNDIEQFSGFSEWVYQVAAALPPERLHKNQLIFGPLYEMLGLDSGSWPSFTAWLDDLAQAEPEELRDRAVQALLKSAREKLEGEVPAAERLLVDGAAYLALVEQLYCCKGKEELYESELYQEGHALLNDPSAAQDLIVTHLRAMWGDVLASEWERNLPMLQESVAAFQTLDFSGMACAEIVRRVTGRELADECDQWQGKAVRIVFIPSAHIGPYVGIMQDDETVKLIFGARVPEGVSASSPALSRSELLMRLNALADDTRLSILELLAGDDGLSSPEVMERLDLSQSAASRHLRQLAATGCLVVERRDGAKVYHLNRNRIGDTFSALQKLLR